MRTDWQTWRKARKSTAIYHPAHPWHRRCRHPGCREPATLPFDPTEQEIGSRLSPAQAYCSIDHWLIHKSKPMWSQYSRKLGSPCWVWNGAPNRRGLPTGSWGGVRYTIGRLIQGLPPLSPGERGTSYLSSSHLCHCNRCVNPAHLVVEPLGDNLRRSVADGHHVFTSLTGKGSLEQTTNPPVWENDE